MVRGSSRRPVELIEKGKTVTTYTKNPLRLPRNLLQVSRPAQIFSILLQTLATAVRGPRRRPNGVLEKSPGMAERAGVRPRDHRFGAEPDRLGGAPDSMTRIMRALDDNARSNTAFLEEGLRDWRRRGSAPDHLVFRRQVADMIEPEALGTLISFAHPADVPVIFEALVDMRDDPLSVRLAAETLARQYIERGFEHIGRRITDAPLWQDPDPGESAVR